MNDSKKEKTIFSFVILLCSLVFYLFFVFYDGVFLFPDSQGYINMEMQREPFYPIFLAVIRLLSGGGDIWLFCVIAVQGVLTALVTWSVTCYFHREFTLNYGLTGLLFAIMLGVSLLCRFGAKRGVMYLNGIETEGICIPLFLLFFRYLLEYVLHPRKKALFLACLLSFILISTRKQMYLTLFLIGFSVLYAMWKEKKFRKGLLVAVLCTGGLFLGCRFFDIGYNYTVRGEFTTHTKDNRFLATMVFYTAEREDAEAIKDTEVRDLFVQIYDICEQNGYLKHSAGEGWANRVAHFGDNYDHIQIDTMGKIIQAYVLESDVSGTGEASVRTEKQTDNVTGEMISAVLPRVWPGIAASFADNVLAGLVTTVAKQGFIFTLYAIAAYLGYVVLLIWNIRKNGVNGVSVLAVLTLVSILLNVAIVSAVIFCQSRYTIYNMPLFYISGLLLLESVWKTCRQH